MATLRHASATVGILLVLAACNPQSTPSIDSSTTTQVVSTTTPVTTSAALVTTTSTMSTSTTATLGGPAVQVFEADPSGCSEDMAVTGTFHAIDESAEPIAAAFQLWLEARLGEQAAEGMLHSAELDDGLLTVDFGDLRAVMNNASTSCGTFSLRAELNATAFQFPDVDRVTYQIEGNCKTFEDWLQRGECHIYTRP